MNGLQVSGVVMLDIVNIHTILFTPNWNIKQTQATRKWEEIINKAKKQQTKNKTCWRKCYKRMKNTKFILTIKLAGYIHWTEQNYLVIYYVWIILSG